MINVKMLSDYPFGIGYGGKEVQMVSYHTFLKTYFSDAVNVSWVDYWDRRGLADTDILHLFGYGSWFYSLINAVRVNKPGIKIILHSTFYDSRRTRMQVASMLSRLCPIPNYFTYKRGMFSNADVIIVNSASEGKQLVSLFGASLSEKIRVIYNAIEDDYKTFIDEEAKDLFLKQYGVEPGYLLCVSFLEERKNHSDLIKAFLQIRGSIGRKLVLIGGYRYMNDRASKVTRELIEKNADSIVHIPYIDRLTDLMRSAYYHSAAHVLPSTLETPGISNLEALYFGKPLLVGECKPVREYFGEHAIYCNSKSLTSISQGIKQALVQKTNPLGADLVGNKYTKSIEVGKVLDVYKKLMVGNQEKRCY